jgi:DNA-binding Xre family transcriptional regulator
MELEQVSKVHKELQRKGFTHNEAQKLLSDDRKSIKLSMLARVCVAFKCLPNDVYDFEGPEGHVLFPLRKAPVVNVRERLGKLSEAELRRVLGLIKN